MFGIIIATCLLAFGMFLKLTNNRGFAQNKKISWIFIGIGGLSLLFKILTYQ